MNDERLDPYSDMWTTDAGRYALVGFDPTRPSSCAIADLSSGGLVVIEEDEEVYAALILRLRDAGARVMTREEVQGR